MAFFVIHCLDQDGALPRRLHHYEAHKAYLAAAPIEIALSGPLLADDGETMIGSFFLVNASSREAVETFSAGDPFRLAKVWASVQIHAFHKRVDRLSGSPAA